MQLTKTNNSHYLIPITIFETCLINSVKKKVILELYPTRKDGPYYLNKFNNYLLDNFKINLKEYCIKYLKIEWPKCPFTNEEVGISRIDGQGLKLSIYKKGSINKTNHPKFAAHCEKMSKERKGSGNPMYGKEAWNKNIDPESSYIENMRNKKLGTKATEQTKEKQRLARKLNPKKARHTTKHSPETIEKLRKNTARLWSEGIFNRVTKIHIKVRKYLETLNLLEKVEEEYQVVYFSMDFAFPNQKIAIECQGTYYHIDPRKYPNGPKDKIQRRNHGRDITKRKVCCDKLGWKIIELWEMEIDNNQFEEILKCKLLEYGLLNH